MTTGEARVPDRLRALFDEVVDLEPDARAARLSRLDPNDPDVAALERLLDADDEAAQRLDGLNFLRAPAAAERRDSTFDAAAAFAPSYTIEKELDGGGMSRVFVGRDAKLGRKIVAKVLPPELAAEVSLERFQYEIRIAAQLRHPHIVPLLESGEAAGSLYYTMPFIEGESLRDRLKRDGTLPVSVALRFAIDIADALAYAHSLGVIHRDIKPGNVLIDSGHAVVADFGIARALSDVGSAAFTRSGAVIGTPAYMSPEQASPDGAVDVRTDVYSLGCVLHEMLCGTPAIGAFGAPASGVRIPARVRAVLTRAMAPLAANRFQSAAELHHALVAAAGPPISKRVARNAGVTVGALLFAGAVVFWPHPDHSFANPASARQLTTWGNVDLAAISPDGKFVAFVTDTVVRVAEVATGEDAIVARDLDAARIWWSPDQSLVYYATNRHEVFAIPKVGPWHTVIADRALAGVSGRAALAGPKLAVWGTWVDAWGTTMSPIDSSLAYWVYTPVWVWPRDGLPPPLRYDRPTAIVRTTTSRTHPRTDTLSVHIDIAYGNLAFSPDGKWLASCGASREGRWRLAMISVDGTVQRLLDSSSFRRPTCDVMWNARGDSLRVWSTALVGEMLSYRIDAASGRVIGSPARFRLPPPPRPARTAFTLSADERRLAYIARARQRLVGVAELGRDSTITPRTANVGALDPSRPRISPAGDRFAYVVTSDSGSAIFVQDLVGGEPRRLTRDYRQGLSGVRWSDDATRLAAVTRNDSQTVILIFDATGRETMSLRPSHAIDTLLLAPSFAWAARSTAIAYLADDARQRPTEVWSIDLATGRERLLLSASKDSNVAGSLPVWSPDGNSIAYSVRDRGALRVKNLMTGTTHDDTLPGPPLLWRADGTFFTQVIVRDGSTVIMRSTGNGGAKMYANLGNECRVVSMDNTARRAVCQITRDQSDVFVVTRR